MMILLISNFFDAYYLKSFKIKKYDATITRFKQISTNILLDGTFEFTDLSFWSCEPLDSVHLFLCCRIPEAQIYNNRKRQFMPISCFD